ncbi:MAG: universal stress protein [Bacteroidetes bacterium]|nr:universal stress protein [Bacteroidota bacterium]
MKKILVPVDFSGHTDITCRYALEFAKVFGAEIKLFHTYFDQIIIADTSFPDTLDMSTIYNEELMKEIFRQAERNMEELEEKVKNIIKKENLADITVTSTVTGGELEHELKSICTEFHPDLVVMGTTGKGNNLNIWGKVSSFIIDYAKVPVITVPEIKSFHGFGTIMFAADLSEGNAETISGLMDLFAVFSARIFVVHFITKAKPGDAYTRMKALQMKFGKEEKTNLISFEVFEVAEDNQAAVDQFVAANKIEMIAFQPHRHSLLYMFFTKNITKKNLFATNVPLLSVPATTT